MSKHPFTIDCHYLQSQFAAAYLIQEGEQALFVENNTAHSVPLLLAALKEHGMSPEQVRYLIVTHVHLDHAGGSSALMKVCPQATLLAHPRAAVHLIDPTRLVKSARQVYGDSVFEELYGEIGPIESSRVRVMEDGEKLSFGSRDLTFFYTRGHANHHFCIFDSFSKGVFTGDSFGLAYPILQREGLFIFPSTSPTDFNPEEARLSIQRILQTHPERVYLTHFGELKTVKEAANQLIEHLNWSERLLEKAIRSGEPDDRLSSFCQKEILAYFQEILERRGMASDNQVWSVLKLDLELNGAGIAYAAQKRRRSPDGV